MRTYEIEAILTYKNVYDIGINEYLDTTPGDSTASFLSVFKLSCIVNHYV